MTIEELSEAIEALSEKVAIQEMTLNVISEAADRLQQKLDEAFMLWGDSND
jgi:uncharacterized coiled-coil protein SlyX